MVARFKVRLRCKVLAGAHACNDTHMRSEKGCMRVRARVRVGVRVRVRVRVRVPSGWCGCVWVHTCSHVIYVCRDFVPYLLTLEKNDYVPCSGTSGVERLATRQ